MSLSTYYNYRLRRQMILIMLISICGCASAGNITDIGKAVGGNREKKDASVDELLRLLDSRYEEINTIKALVNIELDSNPPSPLKSFEGELLYARPRDMKLRGFDPIFPRPLFDFVARGEDFQFRLWQDGKVLEGSLNDLLSGDNIGGTIKIIDLLDIMGAVNTPFIDPSLITVLEKDEEYFILYVIVMHGERGKLDKKIWIDRIDLLARREEIFDLTGERRMVISFDDYRKTEGVERPYRISAEKKGLKVNLSFREIMLNKQLDLDNFNLKGVNSDNSAR